ncbi:MAG: hypothetical protein U0175_32160 [Caldilineaceae bacterium]
MIQQLTNVRPFTSIRHWIDTHWLWLMRVAIIVGVLLVSAALGTHPRLLYLVGLGGLAGVVLFMMSPGLGLLLTLLAGMVVPFYGPSGVGLTQAGLALLLGLWLADILVVDKEIRWHPSPTNLPAMLIVASMLLSFIVGKLPWYRTAQAPLQAQLGGISVYLFSVATYFLVGNRIKDVRWLEWISWIFVGLAWFRILGWLFPAFGRLFTEKLYAEGTLGSLFYLWLACIPLGQALFNTQLKKWQRALLFLIVATTLYVEAGPAYDWKSGWMPAAAGVAVIVVLRFSRLIPLMALLGAVPVVQSISEAMLTDRYSYSTRLDAWSIVFQIVKVNPITGLGPANYYWYTPLFPIRGYAVNFNSHSQYVDMIAQTGILGLIIFFVFMWQVGRLAWSLRKRVPEGFARGYVYSAIGGIVGSLVASWLGDWLLPFVYNVGLHGFRASILSWIFLGGLLLLDRCYPAELAENEVGQEERNA